MKNMFLRIFLACFIFWFIPSLESNAQYTFHNTYPLGSSCSYGGAVQSPDGGYCMTATCNSDVYVFKVDSAGFIVWERRIDVGAAEGVFDITLADLGYVIVGWSIGIGTLSRDPFFLYVDFNGNILQVNRYDQSGVSNAFHSANTTSDGGFIMSGRSNVGPGSSYLMLLTKLTATGTVAWSKSFGGTGWDWGYWAEETFDGGFIILGEADGFGAGFNDAYVVKVDSLGNKQWSRTYGGPSAEQAFCIRQTNDSGYVISGRTLGFDPTNLNPKGFLLKIDSVGVIQWMKTYRETYEIVNFTITPDGGMICMGYISNLPGASFGQNELSVIRTDASGNAIWSYVYGGSSGEGSGLVRNTADGGFILSGLSQSFGSGSLAPYLIKTDSAGISGCSQLPFTATVLSATPVSTIPPDVTVAGLNAFVAFTAIPPMTILHNNVCCNITPITSFNISNDSTGAFVFTNSTHLTAGTTTYLWVFGDGNTSTDTNAVHAYVNTGSYNVCLTATNLCGSMQACSTVVITSSGEQIFNPDKVYFYPNPAQNSLQVSGISENVEMVITDITGRIIYNDKSFSGNKPIDISNFYNGIYSLHIYSKSYSIQEKLIINK